MRKIISRNPFNGVIAKEFKFDSAEQVEAKIQRANEGFQIQKKRSVQERAKMIGHMGSLLQSRIKTITEIVTFEVGKPITQAEGEVKKAVSFCKYYSEHFDSILPTNVKADAKKKTLVKYLPLGPIYYIIPFNFPFYLNFKGGLPNLLIGNCMLARNADSTPQVGEFTEKLMRDAGFDSGEYQNIYSDPNHLGMILGHKHVAGVSFTGSSKAGSIIAGCAGKHLKKAVMELGGNDPFVVLADGDVNLAVAHAIRGRSTNSGQICFSPKRFIIAEQHYASFKEKLIGELSKIKFGDPMDSTCQMGPLARPDLWDNLSQQLKTLPGSYKISWQRQGMEKPFFPITVIEGTDEVYDEELFGPVFTLYKAKNEAHALSLANSGTYGLGASVYSATRGEEFIDQVRAGMGFVNEVVKSDTPYPSGGVGRSGFGRQCGLEGYRQFANIKTHYVN